MRERPEIGGKIVPEMRRSVSERAIGELRWPIGDFKKMGNGDVLEELGERWTQAMTDFLLSVECSPTIGSPRYEFANAESAKVDVGIPVKIRFAFLE